MKIVIYFVNGVKVIQKQGVLKFDLKNQQSTGSPVTYNQRNNICTLTKTSEMGSSLKFRF